MTSTAYNECEYTMRVPAGFGKRSRARESERYRVAARERSARRGRVPVMSAGARKSSSGDERQNENKSTTDASRVGVHTDACGARSRLRAAERQSGCGSESMGKGNPLTRAGQREPSHDGRRDEARREQNGENGDGHGWARMTVGCRVPRGCESLRDRPEGGSLLKVGGFCSGQSSGV